MGTSTTTTLPTTEPAGNGLALEASRHLTGQPSPTWAHATVPFRQTKPLSLRLVFVNAIASGTYAEAEDVVHMMLNL